MRKKYIYDLVTRISHAGIGATILLLLASSQLAQYFYEDGHLRHFFWVIHIYSGYLLIGFFLMRIVWFFKGPKYSRLSNFIKFRTNMKWGWGHHPMAAPAYLLLYATIAFLIYSGLFLARIQFDLGPISEKYYDEMNLLNNFLHNHNTASWLVIIFTITHLGALTFHQIKDRVPIFKSMRTGYQYKRKSSGVLENESD